MSANQGTSWHLWQADLGSNLASDTSFIHSFTHSLNKDLLGTCLSCADHWELNGEQRQTGTCFLPMGLPVRRLMSLPEPRFLSGDLGNTAFQEGVGQMEFEAPARHSMHCRCSWILPRPPSPHCTLSSSSGRGRFPCTFSFCGHRGGW